MSRIKEYKLSDDEANEFVMESSQILELNAAPSLEVDIDTSLQNQNPG